MTPISYDRYTGKKINYLTVLPSVKAFLDPSGRPRKRFLCKCICGKKKYIDQHKVISNHTKSCGCRTSGKRKHHMTNSKEFGIWQGIFDRCYYKKTRSYKFYGAKGIIVCKRWNDFISFFKDMGPCPKDHSIERINPRGNYTPKNCRWIPLKDQQKNKTNSVKIRYGRREYSLYELEKLTGICYGTLYSRIFTNKWSVEKTLTIKPTPKVARKESPPR